jgi:hypothetical protein
MTIPHPAYSRTPRGISVLFLGIAGGMLLSAVDSPAVANAAPLHDLVVESNQTLMDFPNTITFQLAVSNPVPIERVVLEYGVERLTCGEVVAKAFPDFEPAARVETEWTWDMRQSGSEPPGAWIWWRWRVTDSDGREQLVDQKEVVWLDSIHPWQEASDGQIRMHWYEGGTAFGREMLASAVESVEHIRQLIDLTPEGTVQIYLYASYEDLQDAILYEAEWTGGQSYGEHNIIILGVPEGYEDWAKTAIAHELMHNVVDHFTFSCLVRIPTWVHEGLAMVSQGGPDERSMEQFQDAVDRNRIFPLRSLGGNFPEDEDLANLAYAQSYSVVDFLLHRGDAERMRSFLRQLGDGATADDALMQVYGFNIDGLDSAWRSSVGAQPLPAEALAPTATPTIVPTYPPLSFNAAVAVADPGAAGADDSGPPMEYLVGACLCCLCLLMLLVLTVILLLGVARRMR